MDIENAKTLIDNNANELLNVLDNIVVSYTNTLDNIMLGIQTDILALEDPPIAAIERYFVELSNALYFAAGQIERLAVYDGVGKLQFKEKFNDTYLNCLIGSDGKKRTAAELTALAESNSKNEALINDMYNKAYKTIKAKFDAAQTMCSTLSKVYSIKSQQAQADLAIEKYNSKIFMSNENEVFK